MTTLIETASRLAARVTNGVIIAMTAIMMTALIAQVFFRYVLGTSLIWSEELALMLFTWSTLLAATTALREGAHVRLDLLISRLPLRARRIWSSAVMAVVLAVCVIFAVSGYSYTEATLGQVSAAMRVPIETLHLAAPVSGALASLHALARLLDPLPADNAEMPG